eukprot:1624384-Pyramimonas_sp.AAC.1
MEFATGAVDNIYFTAELDTERCAWEPLAYPSTVEAHEQLLPSLAVPSDHAPSLVDFRLARNTLTKASPLQLPVDWGKLVKTPLKVKWNKPWGKKLRDAKPSSLTEQQRAMLHTKRKELDTEPRLVLVHYFDGTTVESVSDMCDALDFHAHGVLTTTAGERVGIVKKPTTFLGMQRHQRVRDRIQFDGAGSWLVADDIRRDGDLAILDLRLALHVDPPVEVSIVVTFKWWPSRTAYAGCAPGLRLQLPTSPARPLENRRVGTVSGLREDGAGYDFRVDNGEIESLDPHPSLALSLETAPCSVYPPGHRLVVLYDGELRDATVVERNTHGARYRLRIGDRVVEIDLNCYNHCEQRMGSVDQFHAAAVAYAERLTKDDKFVKVEDGITGNRLRIADQTIQITTTSIQSSETGVAVGVQRPDWVGVPNVQELSKLLVQTSPERPHGTHE